MEFLILMNLNKSLLKPNNTYYCTVRTFPPHAGSLCHRELNIKISDKKENNLFAAYK